MRLPEPTLGQSVTGFRDHCSHIYPRDILCDANEAVRDSIHCIVYIYYQCILYTIPSTP